jgi:hypothetical protein
MNAATLRVGDPVTFRDEIRPANRVWPDLDIIPEFTEPGGPKPGFLYAAGGWCAPSDTVYDFLGSGTAREPNCPEWNAIEDECVARSYWDPSDVTEKSWHSCEYEFSGPHTVCKCEDCGAERVVLKGESWKPPEPISN